MYIGQMSNNYTIPVSNIGRVTPVNTDNSVDSASTIKGAARCETCENRKYVDGSNESDVSFKTPGVIKPEESYAKVSSHERQHVSNAVSKGQKPGARLISVSVSLQMSTCPECGKRYVSGGLTESQIKYNESNPYENNRKIVEESVLAGNNLDERI